MNPRTLIALQESIEHWERVCFRIDSSIGPASCSLCNRFLSPLNCTGCKNNEGEICPVAERTGQIGCKGSPWTQVAISNLDFGKDSKEFREAAEKELSFLKSLLPEYCNPPLPSQNLISMILL